MNTRLLSILEMIYTSHFVLDVLMVVLVSREERAFESTFLYRHTLDAVDLFRISMFLPNAKLFKFLHDSFSFLGDFDLLWNCLIRIEIVFSNVKRILSKLLSAKHLVFF